MVGQGTYYTHLLNGAKVGVAAVWKGETLAVAMGPLPIEHQGVGDRMVQTITLNGVSATRKHYRVKEKCAIGNFGIINHIIEQAPDFNHKETQVWTFEERLAKAALLKVYG